MAKPVAIFASRTEAEIARAHLESVGIESQIVTDSAGGWEPQLDAIRGVRLVVADAEASLAAEVLDVPELRPVDSVPRAYPDWVLQSAMLLIAIMVVAGLALTIARFF